MNIKLICVGKTTDKRVQLLIDDYLKRLKHYTRFSIEIVEFKKKTEDINLLKSEEGKLLLNRVAAGAYLILLDEKGKEYTSEKFASFIEKKQNQSIRELIFIIGGAYGFSEEVYNRSDHSIALSKMTFTHQMVRAIFIEQLYRGHTIIRGEKYHH